MNRIYMDLSDTKFFKDKKDFIENSKKVNSLAKEFFEMEGIPYKGIYVDKSEIGIIPGDEFDESRLGLFKKAIHSDGLRLFRRNTRVYNGFRKYLEQNDCKVMSEPRILLYCFPESYRRVTIETLIFLDKDECYAYMSSRGTLTKDSIPEGGIEITEVEYMKKRLEYAELKEGEENETN